MRSVSVLVLLLMSVMSVGSFAADEAKIRSGFSTGEKYIQMTAAQKRYYAMGVVNGMLLAPVFGAPKENLTRLENCISGMSDTQVAAILTEYLNKHPGEWNETPHMPMYRALTESCAK